MTNWDLYNLVHAVANKDVYSNWLKPSDFEVFLKTFNIRLLRERLGLPERYQPGTFQAGASASRIIENDTVPFLVNTDNQTVVGGVATMEDWYYINDWYTDGSLSAEIISQQEVGPRINHPQLAPTAQYPFATIVQAGLKVWPTTITSIHVSYYRKPVDPVFVTIIDETTGEMTYDATNSVELEWDNDNKIGIAYSLLQALGINIERADLSQYAQKLVEGGK